MTMFFVWNYCINFNPQNWSNLHGLERLNTFYSVSLYLEARFESLPTGKTFNIVLRERYYIILHFHFLHHVKI